MEYDEEKHMQQERNDAREDGIQEGLQQGLQQGRLQQVNFQICRKLRKGKSVVQIADELEEEIPYVEDICRTANNYAPEYDENKVYKAVMLKNAP